MHTDYENILVGNGSTELISLVAQIMQPKNALIVGPTYSEYEHEISLVGGRSHYFRLQESDRFLLDIKALSKALTKDVDLLVLCNPNNPTSSQIDRQTMRIILITARNTVFLLWLMRLMWNLHLTGRNHLDPAGRILQ